MASSIPGREAPITSAVWRQVCSQAPFEVQAALACTAFMSGLATARSPLLSAATAFDGPDLVFTFILIKPTGAVIGQQCLTPYLAAHTSHSAGAFTGQYLANQAIYNYRQACLQLFPPLPLGWSNNENGQGYCPSGLSNMFVPYVAGVCVCGRERGGGAVGGQGCCPSGLSNMFTTPCFTVEAGGNRGMCQTYAAAQQQIGLAMLSSPSLPF